MVALFDGLLGGGQRTILGGDQLLQGVNDLVQDAVLLENAAQDADLDDHGVTALDIHVEGVAEDNTVPMLIPLKNLLPAVYLRKVKEARDAQA